MNCNPSYRLVRAVVILLSTLQMPWSLLLKPQHQSAPTGAHFTGKRITDDIFVYEPPTSTPSGSLILLMGYGADLSWTLSQWWYLHPAWLAKDREWCQGTCVFDNGDKTATHFLRNNLRIVDAVGPIVLAKESHAWYHYTVWPDGPPVAQELEVAVSTVFQLIEQEHKIIGDYKKILIAGMSQGADLALEVGMRFPHQLGMVISQRGVLSEPRKLEIQTDNQTLSPHSGTPFILTAGDRDELTSLAGYKESCSWLQYTKAPVHLATYPGLNHGDFSKPEWKLLIQAFSLMLPYPSQAATCGGTGKGAPCVFPFTYKGLSYSGCISVGSTEPWCATDYVQGTTDANNWGKCNCQVDHLTEWTSCSA